MKILNMFKKIGIIIILILIFGLYTGWYVEPGVCNGPYRQRAIGVSIIKPFFPGTWHFYLGFGNKHWDYKETRSLSKIRECKVKGTNDVFGSDYEVGEEFEMECVWVKSGYINRSGCAYWYNKDYYLQGNVIDLTPWSKKVKD